MRLRDVVQLAGNLTWVLPGRRRVTTTTTVPFLGVLVLLAITELESPVLATQPWPACMRASTYLSRAASRTLPAHPSPAG